MNQYNNDQRKMQYSRQDYGQPNGRQMNNYDHPVRNMNNIPSNDHHGQPMRRQQSGGRQPQYQNNRGQNRSNGHSMNHQHMRMQNQRRYSANDDHYQEQDMMGIQDHYMPQERMQQGPIKQQVRCENQQYANKNNLNQRRDSNNFEQYPDHPDRQPMDSRRMHPRQVKPIFNNDGQEIFEVYVHNVDFEVTANDVVNCFRHCGPIDHWKFPRKDATRQNHGRHKGYGFIFFKTKQGQVNALNMKRNPPYIGNRHINISDNAAQQTEEELVARYQQEDQYLNQSRPNLRDHLSRQQEPYFDKYGPMDQFQRYDDGPPMMMDRMQVQRRNFDDSMYQNNMDHYIPPRNMDDQDDLSGQMGMQKFQSSRDFDRGRINVRQYLDDPQQDRQYIDTNNNLVVTKRSNDNVSDYQDQKPLSIKKKSDDGNEKNQFNQQPVYKKEICQRIDENCILQNQNRRVVQNSQEGKNTKKNIQTHQNVKENKEFNKPLRQQEVDDNEDRVQEQSEKKSINVEDLDELRKLSPNNGDLQFDQTIGTPNDSKREIKENSTQPIYNNGDKQEKSEDKAIKVKLNPEICQPTYNDHLQNTKEQSQEQLINQNDNKIVDSDFVSNQDDKQEQVKNKNNNQENKDNLQEIERSNSRSQKDIRDQRDLRLQRQFQDYDYPGQREQSNNPNYRREDMRMSKTESLKPENTNKYNPNNREFIGYKSDLVAKPSSGRVSQNSRENRDNHDYRHNRENRDLRSRGNDQDNFRQSNDHRMIKGMNQQRDMRQNDTRREDHRRVDNMRIMSRGQKSDQYGPTHNNQRRDDYYGRQHQRPNEKIQNDFLPNRRDQRSNEGQYGPQRMDGNYDEERLQNKRSYNQMNNDAQGFHDEPIKRQRRHDDTHQDQQPIQERQIDQRDDGSQININIVQRPQKVNVERQKQYNDWKNQYNENRNNEGEYDSDNRQYHYRQREVNAAKENKNNRKYTISPERLNYEKQQVDDVVVESKQYDQALDLYGEDDNNYNEHDQQSSNQDHFENYEEFENKSISFHEQLNEEKQKNKQKYGNN